MCIKKRLPYLHIFFLLIFFSNINNKTKQNFIYYFPQINNNKKQIKHFILTNSTLMDYYLRFVLFVAFDMSEQLFQSFLHFELLEKSVSSESCLSLFADNFVSVFEYLEL